MVQLIKILTISVMFAVILNSCNEKAPIHYKCGTICITRVDKDGESTFYYGNSATCDSGSVKAEYHGLNNGMDIYLFFFPDDKVELIHYGSEYLHFECPTPLMKVGDYNNRILDTVVHKKMLSSKGYIRISNVLKLEKQWRQESSNKLVEISYPD